MTSVTSSEDDDISSLSWLVFDVMPTFQPVAGLQDDVMAEIQCKANKGKRDWVYDVTAVNIWYGVLVLRITKAFVRHSDKFNSRQYTPSINF